MYLESERECVCLSDGMHIEVRGQPSGVLSLFPPHGFWGSGLAHQSWLQTPTTLSQAGPIHFRFILGDVALTLQ